MSLSPKGCAERLSIRDKPKARSLRRRAFGFPRGAE
jgi:hypothetical protein